MYYGTVILTQVLVGIIYYISNPNDLGLESDTLTGIETVIAFASIPVGILAVYLFYKYISKKWKKESSLSQIEIDNIGQS